MPSPDREAEHDRLRLILEQIETGQLVIRNGADDAIAELHQRLAGSANPFSSEPGSEACAG